MRRVLSRLPGVDLWPRTAPLGPIRVALRGSPLSRRMRKHVLRGWYETAERDLVTRLVHAGDRVLELGASAGVLTSLLATRVGPDGRVVAVEADARLRSHWERQLALNDVRAELVHALAWPVFGRPVPEDVRRRRFSPAGESLSGHATGGDTGDTGDTVPWRTAEQLCRDAGLEPTVLVIDVEGAEAAWYDAPPGLPPSVRLVILEVHPKTLGADRAGDVVQAALDEGFRVVGLRASVVALGRPGSGIESPF